jgi:hypothetical protein
MRWKLFTLAPPETTTSTASGTYGPASLNSVKRACDQATSPSNTSHGLGA